MINRSRSPLNCQQPFTGISSMPILARESSQPISDPVTLIAPMLARFMATDRAFAKARHARERSKTKDG